MTPHQRRPCPLTIRLAQDLKIRNMAERTIDAYTFHAARFADFIKKPLDRVTPEDVLNRAPCSAVVELLGGDTRV